MAALSLRALSKTFPGGVRAVDALTLEVAPGERVVLLGPSGCGKTTTLRLIAGLETADAGRVVLAGEDVTNWPPHRRGVALVFQDAALYPHLSVRDNLAFGARLQKTPADEIAARVDTVSRRLGLAPLFDRRPEHLSGGERRRVALERALVRRPRLLLLDEPLSSLDVPARVELRGELARLHREEPVTTLHVTHDQEEAMLLADRLAVMREGRVVQAGTPQELYARPADSFVAGFLGSPPMNFLRRTRDGVECLLGVRPRDLRLTSEAEADVTAVVENVQDLGHERLVTLRGPQSKPMLLVLRGSENVRLGERVGFRFDAETTHWFDGRTGTRLND